MSWTVTSLMVIRADGDDAETAVGLGAGLDPPGRTVPVGGRIAALARSGRRCPNANPMLTTVAVPQEKLGREACERLSAILRGEDCPADICLTPRLKVRSTTGPAWGESR